MIKAFLCTWVKEEGFKESPRVEREAEKRGAILDPSYLATDDTMVD